jgi:broad specificity phosphatase PhoE
LLVYVRHGATALNKGGSEERLRGWLPLPLSDLGEKQAGQTARRLARIIPTPDTFVSSDLPRALQTAGTIGQAIGMDPTPDTRIRDWNTGKLAGQKVEDVLPQLQYFVQHPDEAPDGGEPLNEYRQRFEPAMRERVAAPGIHLVVGHARGATILEGAADPEGGKGGDIPMRFLLERPNVKPGGILIIGKDWNTNVDNPTQED